MTEDEAVEFLQLYVNIALDRIELAKEPIVKVQSHNSFHANPSRIVLGIDNHILVNPLALNSSTEDFCEAVNSELLSLWAIQNGASLHSEEFIEKAREAKSFRDQIRADQDADQRRQEKQAPSPPLISLFSIRIADTFFHNGHISFGLEVKGDGPLVVGCSFKVAGKIIDQPARWLQAPKIALWQVHESEREEIFSKRSGQVMFALWPDEAFTRRLGETGWVEWNLLGMGMVDSAKQDLAMKKYYVK